MNKKVKRVLIELFRLIKYLALVAVLFRGAMAVAYMVYNVDIDYPKSHDTVYLISLIILMISTMIDSHNETKANKLKEIEEIEEVEDESAV